MMKAAWDFVGSHVPPGARRTAQCLRPAITRCHRNSLNKAHRKFYTARNKQGVQGQLFAASTTLALSEDDVIAFCLDSAIADLSYLTVAVAYNAAQTLWPQRVVGPVGLYVDKARPILPALAEQHHAVVLVRLLADEGVIGARSTAGREGPVVGRAVRTSGSRPLLVAEIAEHWPVVMDSCLLRWSREGQGAQPSALEPAGSSSSSSSSDGDRGAAPNRRDALLAQAWAAFRAAQAALLRDTDAVEACLSHVTPYPTTVEALKGSARSHLLLISTLPADLGLRVLGRCGLLLPEAGIAAAAAGRDLVCAPSWRGVLAHVVGRVAAGGGRVQLVTGNLARLEQLVEGSGGSGSGEVGAGDWEELQRELRGAGEHAEGSARRLGTTPAGTSAGATAAAMAAQATGPVAVGPSVAGHGGKGSMGGACSSSVAAEERWREAAATAAQGRSEAGADCSCGVDGNGGGSTRGSGRRGRSGHLGMEARAAAEPGSSGRHSGEPFLSRPSGAAAARGDVDAVGKLARSASTAAGSGEQQHRAAVASTSAPAGEPPRPQSAHAASSSPSSSSSSVSAASASAAPTASAAPHRSSTVLLCTTAEAQAAGLTLSSPTTSRSLPDSLPADADLPSPSSSNLPGDGNGDGAADSGPRSSPWAVLRMVHLAEWSCPSMSFRARALSYRPRASLLSEHQLAEWLGVTHLDVVMDGVAWR